MLSATKELQSPEMAPLYSWFQKEIARLPEMKVTKAPLTDGKDWKKAMLPNGEIDKVSNRFFSIEGIDVQSHPLSWHQGAIIQRSEHVPTVSGEKTEVSGMVILIENPKGETFVTVAQEPLANAVYSTPDKKMSVKWIPQGKEVHPVVRGSIQTSVEKLNRILSNESTAMKYDPKLTTLLDTVAAARQDSIANVLKSIPLSKAPTDGNRISTHVAYGRLEVSDATAQKISDALPDGRWCSAKELDALVISGLTNGHLNVARSITQAQQRLVSNR